MRSLHSSFSSSKSNNIHAPSSFSYSDQLQSNSKQVRRLIYINEENAVSSDNSSNSSITSDSDTDSERANTAASSSSLSSHAILPSSSSQPSSHEILSTPNSASSSIERRSRGSRTSLRRAMKDRPSVIEETDENRGRSRRNQSRAMSGYNAVHAMLASVHLVNVMPTVYSPEDNLSLSATQQERVIPFLPEIDEKSSSAKSKQKPSIEMLSTDGYVADGTHICTGAGVALKSFSRRKMIQHRAEGKIKKEIYFLTLLRHPNIVKLYDVIDKPSELIIVMEYAPNDLFNYIVAEEDGHNTRIISENEGRRLFQQLICAVEWCHAHQVVHRDLKPENILLDQNYNVKLADFGLSGIIRDGEFLRTSCGSPNYASPEVITGKQYTGPEIDVWSCGIILYVLLVSRLPFDDDFIPTLFKKITHGVFRIPPDISPEVAILIRRMLVCDPVGRITLSEIRSNPWFTKNLADNLKDRPHNTIPPKYDDLEAIATIGEQYDFGEIDMDIVDYLTTTMMSFDSTEIIEKLRQSGSNNIKVGYRLHKDRLADAANKELLAQQRQAEAAAAVSEAISLEKKASQPTFADDTSKPQQDNLINNARGALRVAASSVRRGTSASEGVLVPGLLPSSLPRSSPHRWYFGIKSRSPPMEVMCELYHTLKSLGMEWRECILPVAPRITGESEDHLPRPRSPFFAEARCRVNNVIIRLDLQLYRQGGEDQDWLVDFRNVGYQPVSPDSKGFEEFKDDLVECIDDPVENWYKEDRTEEERKIALTAAIQEEFNPRDRPVVSPFLFMKTACKMISALAGLPD